jgi:ABC-type transport system substrate-binding protein
MGTLALGSTRAHYGGSLRLQVREKVVSLDPADPGASSVQEQLASLLFEGLTAVSPTGTVQPWLATSWESDPQQRVWRFHLRHNVHFQDGSVLNAVVVAPVLAATNPNWKVRAGSLPDEITIETEGPSPNLPALLALPRNAITRKNLEGALVGTGPFALQEWQPGERALFVANDDHWSGRPFLDSLEVLMGQSTREQLLARRLDRDDAVEVLTDQVRPLAMADQKTSLSKAPDLLALFFFRAPVEGAGGARVPVNDPRLRQALSQAIDRNAISNVLFQKQAESANGVLPEWLTGYSFLFNTRPDADNLRRLRSEFGPLNLRLAYDSSDAAAKAVAERVAVNARDGGVNIQVYGEPGLLPNTVQLSHADVVLVRIPLGSANPAAALSYIAEQVNSSAEIKDAVRQAHSPEELFQAEKQFLENGRLVPIVFVPRVFWLGHRVHDWQSPLADSWKLGDVWVETAGRP